MSGQDIGTTVADAGTDSSSNVLVRLQLTVWEQIL